MNEIEFQAACAVEMEKVRNALAEQGIDVELILTAVAHKEKMLKPVTDMNTAVAAKLCKMLAEEMKEMNGK